MYNVPGVCDVFTVAIAKVKMCRSAHLHILGAEAEERSDEAHYAVLYAVPRAQRKCAEARTAEANFNNKLLIIILIFIFNQKYVFYTIHF